MVLSNLPYKILALDIDGTLLDGSGQLRHRTIAAVARVAKRGIRPVLCTGRRFRRALPVATQLGINAPIICNSGALIKNPDDQSTLWRADLAQTHAEETLRVFQACRQPAVTFLDQSLSQNDYLIAEGRTGLPLFDDYVNQNREHASIDPQWMSRPSLKHFHLCAIGSRDTMLEFERKIHARLAGQVQTFVQKSPRYAGTMCEILRQDANKWTALLQLARLWDVDPSEICAVGDDRNDVAMIREAGLGVAMGHAHEEVRSVANLVTGSDDQDGVAMLIENILCP